jgi:hypothetical protein
MFDVFNVHHGFEGTSNVYVTVDAILTIAARNTPALRIELYKAQEIFATIWAVVVDTKCHFTFSIVGLFGQPLAFAQSG